MNHPQRYLARFESLRGYNPELKNGIEVLTHFFSRKLVYLLVSLLGG